LNARSWNLCYFFFCRRLMPVGMPWSGTSGRKLTHGKTETVIRYTYLVTLTAFISRMWMKFFSRNRSARKITDSYFHHAYYSHVMKKRKLIGYLEQSCRKITDPDQTLFGWQPETLRVRNNWGLKRCTFWLLI
jgi:hypothetical protein